MLRKEIQEKTGLTRKAIEYYQEKGLIHPQKEENGYRDYSKKDLETLEKISLYRRLDLNLEQIRTCLAHPHTFPSSILRKKQKELGFHKRKLALLKDLEKGHTQGIKETLDEIEREENLYTRLERAFPGYLGQLLFSSYKPFLDQPLAKDQEEAFKDYMDYLDQLPKLPLTQEEVDYIEKTTSSFDAQALDQIQEEKIKTIENHQTFLEENAHILEKYREYKESPHYQNSPLKTIREKFEKYMEENKYYQTAIPLIRKFSPSYDRYYTKLLEADGHYRDKAKE